MEDNLLVLNSISKSFPGVKALDNISFSVKRGDIHCIVGENGAGKSTLIKILSGAIQKDTGTISFDGVEAHIKNSYDAKKLGIGTVYQEMSLVPSLNAIDNIFLGEEKINGFMLDRHAMQKQTKAVLTSLHAKVNTTIPVRFLSTAQQQMIEITRNLVFEKKLIIMDEPTSSLSQNDTNELFRIIHKLKEQGVTIIYISHKMEELEKLSDRITVMRDGCHVGTVDFKSTGIKTIISMMVGREFNLDRRYTVRKLDNEVVLKVEKFSDYRGKVKNVSFDLTKGIILGFAGLVGAGRTELMRMIFGADRKKEGKLYVKNNLLEKITTETAVKHGLAYLSEDRKTEALLLKLPIRTNISLANLSRVCKQFIINHVQEKIETETLKNKLQIVTSSLKKPAMNLSGGNQQKVAIAKWLFSQCDIVIFDEPTRGIDVGARSGIYTLMNQLVDEGMSIILVSSDMNEILSLSNVIITMYNGKITNQLINGPDVNQETIMRYMLGG